MSGFDDEHFDLKSLIQFDLLQKIIEKFMHKNKVIEDKILLLEYKMNHSQNIYINNPTNNNTSSVHQDEPLNKSFPVIPEQDDSIISESEKDSFTTPNPVPPSITTIIKPDTESANKIASLSDIISALTKRINQAENDIKQIKQRKEDSTNKGNEEMMTKITEMLNGNESKINKIEDEVKNMKVKIQDFNIYDMFKDSGNPNVDATTAMIKTLEGKFITKFNFIDEKFKVNDEEVLKLKNDMVNIKNLTDSTQRSLVGLKEKSDQQVNPSDAAIGEQVKQKMKSVIDQTKKELIGLIDKNDLKFQQLISLIDKRVVALSEGVSNGNKNSGIDLNDFNEKLNSKMDEMKIILNQSISDNEKYTKSLIEKLNLDQLRRDFNLVKQSLMTKLEKKDLNDLYLKHDELKTSLLALKEQFDQLKTNGDVLSEANTKILKQIEYLNGLIATIKVNSNNSAKSNDTSNIDLSKYATYTDLNNAIKNSQNETKKINAEIEEIKSALLKLTSNLRYFASENDMKNMEQCILNDFEEYKQAANKKFADKLEMQKAFKYLEIQIKSMTESFSNKEQGDNWLLAKKPIGMFHCASCDSFIGELNTKNEYLPWNKMQPREDNKYRMGHGFSRMLQMVNVDILKSVEGIKENNNTNNVNERNLPKINYSSNFSSNNGEKNTLNISADNINNIGSNDSNNMNDYGEISGLQSKRGPRL